MNPKKEREIIYNKFCGKCAYCGCELPARWHADHMQPIERKTKTIPGHWLNPITGDTYQTWEIKKMRALPEEQNAALVKVEAREVPDGCRFPDRDTIENKVPCCPQCNNYKSNCDIETFRSLIANGPQSLRRYSTQYKFATKYNLITETGAPVKFYFEIINEIQNPPVAGQGGGTPQTLSHQ